LRTEAESESGQQQDMYDVRRLRIAVVEDGVMFKSRPEGASYRTADGLALECLEEVSSGFGFSMSPSSPLYP
jgi:hypothetical protein